MEVSVAVIILLMAMFMAVISMILYSAIHHLMSDVRRQNDMLNKLYLEMVMQDERQANQEDMFPRSLLSPPSSGVMFTTQDGKHTATNPQEFIKKLKEVPSYNLTPEEETELLESMTTFRDNMLADLDDDEGDLPEENWKK